MSDPNPGRAPRWWPSPVAIHILVVASLLIGAMLAKGAWDADYFWHYRTGELIATAGLFSTDPFSFTWGGKPWVLHEWLGQLLIYRLVDGPGYVPAVIAFALLPGMAIAILALGLARNGARTAAVIAGTGLAALLMVPYMTLRPQLISWVFFAILTVAMVSLRPQHRRWTLLAAPFFALWANVHGLWAVALGVLALYTLLTVAGRTSMAPARWWVAGSLVGAVLGTALTPAGPAGVLYPLRYVEGGDWGLANIVEWQSPDFHDPAHLPLLAFIAALLLVGRRGVPPWMTLLGALGIVMALLALRNAPIAAILGLPALVTGLSTTLDELRPRRVVHSARIATGRRVIEVAAGLIIVVAGLLLFIPRDPMAAVEASMEAHLPIQGVDLLGTVDPDARVVAEYGWGGYVIGELYPTGARVMVDGRNDMYSEAILAEYGMIRDADPGWDAIADRYRADALLFPLERAITKGPALDAGWCEAHRDENEVLYLRSCP